jgi:hypothetical protein
LISPGQGEAIRRHRREHAKTRGHFQAACRIKWAIQRTCPCHTPARDDVKGRLGKLRAKLEKQPSRRIDDKMARNAALAFEREQKQRQRERRKEEAAAVKERDRREKAVAKAQAAIEKAKAEHEKRAKHNRSRARSARKTVAGGGRAFGEADGEAGDGSTAAAGLATPN